MSKVLHRPGTFSNYIVSFLSNDIFISDIFHVVSFVGLSELASKNSHNKGKTSVLARCITKALMTLPAFPNHVTSVTASTSHEQYLSRKLLDCHPSPEGMWVTICTNSFLQKTCQHIISKFSQRGNCRQFSFRSWSCQLFETLCVL